MLDLDKEALTIFPTLDLGPDCEGSNLVGRVGCVEDDTQVLIRFDEGDEAGHVERDEVLALFGLIELRRELCSYISRSTLGVFYESLGKLSLTYILGGPWASERGNSGFLG